MSKITLLLAALAALAACTATHDLSQPRGSWVPANPGKWQPTPADLRP